jgi:hypothetical protein
VATVHKVGDPLAFYGVVATILPVLFLALTYQSRVFDDLDPLAATSAALVGYVVLAFGELESLFALANQKATNESRGVCALCVFALLIVVAIHPAIEAGRRHSQRRMSKPKRDKRPLHEAPAAIRTLILVFPSAVTFVIILLLR